MQAKNVCRYKFEIGSSQRMVSLDLGAWVGPSQRDAAIGTGLLQNITEFRVWMKA